jgi:protein tyrosine phosphatase (PTP) superfamily phosphohydrolase (DUF442 family)
MALPKNFRRAPGRNNWRGASILTLDSMRELKSRGIKTIINLALDSTRKQKCAGGRYPSRPCEPMWAKQLGLRYIPVYLGSRPPSASGWAKIKSAMMDGNAFIHCTYGADRTGAVIGRFRLETEPGLDPNQVLQEAKSFGFKPRSHPGYGKGPDPNRRLREWMMAGRFQGQRAPGGSGNSLPALPGGWVPWAIGGSAFLILVLVLRLRGRRAA